MDILLVFFALPLATIIIAIVLERIWKNYILVTAFIFAIYLIVVFAAFDADFLVAAIAYTILAFIAAFLSMLFRKLNDRLSNLERRSGRYRRDDGDDNDDDENRRSRRICNCRNNCNNNENNENATNLLTISSSCGGGENNSLLTINSNCSRNENRQSNGNNGNFNCNCSSNNSREIDIAARIVPNSSNNGRTGCFRGSFRRRC